MHVSGPQALVRVDIADARHDALVQEDRLDGTARGAHSHHDVLTIKRGVEQIAGDMAGADGEQGGRAAHPTGGAIRRGHQIGDMQAAEYALIDQFDSSAPGSVPINGDQMKTHAQMTRPGGELTHESRGANGRRISVPDGIALIRVGIASALSTGRGSRARAADKELTAHPEVGRQRTAIIQVQPQELPPADGRSHRPP